MANVWALILLGCAARPVAELDNAAAPQQVLHDEARAAGFTPLSTDDIDVDALDILLWRAWESRSDSLVVWRDGQLLAAVEAGPIETMSVTKSIVALAVALLLDEGALDSIDVSASTWFEAWRGTPYESITLRHLLEHTSGLSTPASREIYASSDFVEFALALPLEAEPGSQWIYNNAGSNLVAAIASQVAGEPVDAYLQRRLFDPLGIGPVQWQRDDAGNVHGLAGLALSADDLLRIGRLMLAEGAWEGEQLLQPERIRELTTGTEMSGGSFGQQWWVVFDEEGPCVLDAWLFAQWERSGVPADFIDAIRPLEGRDLREAFDDVAAALGGGPDALETYYDHTWRAQRPDCHVQRRPVAFKADGWLGQQLVVVPAAGFVGVRQRRSEPGHDTYGSGHLDGFPDFPQLLDALSPE